MNGTAAITITCEKCRHILLFSFSKQLYFPLSLNKPNSNNSHLHINKFYVVLVKSSQKLKVMHD